ncbi:oligosaccharide flippase family protein [Ruegeria profundi]|uniref:oligosaccharide flippase family protein n=1 Tax=Ruegeria profundi TaxID=1685378 RepID=UPI001CD23CF1|nr:oligosaccharide flippase family protein [Ruegeria profundi]MCA0929563.1 oligosaccharide flippase family protein [Ruegeria profundi]
MTWYFVPRMLSAFIAIVILIVMTRVLGAADFGRYNLTLLSGMLLFSFTFQWLAISIGRFHHAPEFEGQTIATVLGASALLGVFLLCLVGLVRMVLPAEWVSSFFLAVVFCTSHAMYELGTVCLRQYNEGPKFAAVTLLRQALGVSLAVTFVVYGGGYASAVIGMSMGAAITGAYALVIALRRSGIVVPSRGALRTYFRFGFPLAVVSSSASFFAMSSQSLLAFFAGMDAAGYFAAAQTLASKALKLPMTTLSRVVAPSVFEAHETNGLRSSDAVLERYFSFLVLISMPIVVALVFAADVFTHLLFEQSFADETALYLRLLSPAAFIVGLQGAYFSYAFMRSKKTGLQLGISVASLVVHALLSLVTIYLFGASGAPIAFLISGVVSFVAYYYIGRKVDPLRVSTTELKYGVLGAIAYAPFCISAGMSANLTLQLALLAAGLMFMFWVLVLLGQVAAVVVWRRAREFVSWAKT